MSVKNAKKIGPMIVEQFRSATVIGLGATGYSVVRYLRARGFLVAVADTRAQPALASILAVEYPEVDTHFGSLKCAAVHHADLLVVSPGVSIKHTEIALAKQNGARVVGDIQLFIEENSVPLIAITGSNGKSTVTSLVGQMCEAGGLKTLVAGNIGRPALDALTDKLSFEVAVLELSSFQLETTRSVPAEAAAILNISADHMDRYDSMGDYVLAKARILRHATRAILPRHEEQLEQITNVSTQFTFGLDAVSDDNAFGIKKKKSGRWLVKGRDTLMPLKDIPLTGSHNVLNVLSAFALVDFLQIPNDRLVAAVKAFQGLPHRMQTVTVHNGVTWVNDSKATNVGAAVSALQSLDGQVIWLAGGEGKGANFAELHEVVGPTVKLAVLFGADAASIEQAIDDVVPVLMADSLIKAVSMAHSTAEEGDIVLLSPACASFDMFDDFEHRGLAFTQAVTQVLAQTDNGVTQ